jgi:O-antigen ligase
MAANKSGNLFLEYFSYKANIGFIFALPILATIAVYSYFAQDALVALLGVAVLLALPYFWLCIRFPKLWIYTIALCTTPFLTTSGKGLSVADVVLGVVYLGGLIVWFYYILFIKKDKIVKNTADWLIIFFYVASFGCVIIAYLNDVDFIDAFKEYANFSVTLLYFPIRYYFNEKEDLKRLLIVFAISIFIVELIHFYRYYVAATTNLVYAYQLARTVKTNQALFVAASISAIVFFFYTKGWRNRLLLGILAGFSTAALITTFSRAFWIVLLVQVAILFLLLPLRKKIELGVLVATLTAIVLSLAFLFMKDNTKLLLGVVEARFVSASKGTKDVSVQARFAEYQATFVKIRENPLGGNGYFKSFSYIDPLTGYTLTAPINHNGYIYLVYRLGFPLAIVYLLFFLSYIFKSIKYMIISKDKFFKAISIVAFMYLLLIAITNFVTPTLSFRDGIFVTILSVVFISSAEKFYIFSKNNKKINEN